MAKCIKYTLLVLLIFGILASFINPSTKFSPQAAYGLTLYKNFLPLFFHQPLPLASTSYYMTTLDPDLLYKLGCELGKRDKNTYGAQDSVAVLSFGYPRCFSDGGFGANLYGWGPATLEGVSSAVKQFSLGYYTCTGTDYDSNLVIGVGTSNYRHSDLPDLCDTLASAAAHGTAWSAMVRDLNQWAQHQGVFHQVQVYGANNLEVGWNTPEWSRAWIAGFEKVSGNFMLHFGDAAGCPYEDKPHWSCGTSTYPEWTLEDVWFVSYGAPSALPLPLIYLTTGVHAKQWAYLSQYSVKKHGYRMDFSGVFTQWQYCQQFDWCYTTDNTPEQAYQQLTTELRKNPATAQEFIRWKTDIRWIMQNEIPVGGLQLDTVTDVGLDHPLQVRADALGPALQTSSLSPELRTSLESKQLTYQAMAEMAQISRSNPAPKDAPIISLPVRAPELIFQSGIIENGEMPGLPYGAEVINTWQKVTVDGYLQIGAGSSPADPHRGALYILLTSPDLTGFQSKLILAPEGCGPLKIIEEGSNLLHVHSSEGCSFIFDWTAWTLTPSGD